MTKNSDIPFEPPFEPKTDFGKLLYRWRNLRGILNNSAFARVLGVKDSVVLRWLKADVRPDITTLLRIAERTRQYDEQYPPNYDDPLYPWKSPGIPIKELLATQGVELPAENDFWDFLLAPLSVPGVATESERKFTREYILRMKKRYEYGEFTKDEDTDNEVPAVS